MSSPEPIDPYLSLGVAKDADISAIRSAHRKLVLKFHPDRIKDEAERAKGKDVFQKVQQAYELLSDPARRSRYDDEVKLAELRKEAMARNPPQRSSSFQTRSAAAPPRSTPSREFRDGRMYEERVPSGSFFEEGARYREDESRASSRKYDGYERRSSGGQPEKERKSSKWDKPAAGLSFEMAFKLKKTAARAKESVREKTRESHAANAKSRDREQRRDRSEKHGRRAYVEEDSSSDSDTVTYVSTQPARSSRPEQPSPQRTGSKQESPRQKSSPTTPRHDEDLEDEWERRHGSARDYIERSQKRPTSSRTDSTRSYWAPAEEQNSGRKSGSDSDRRPTSSKGRRPSIDVQRVRPPPMPSQNSAPAGLKATLEHRDGPPTTKRSSTGITRDRRKEMPRETPQMHRSQTMPLGNSSRRSDTLPTRGSNLKHAETHDSGYGSSGGLTPEMHGTSPPKHTSTKYQIVDEDEEYSRSSRTILVDPEDQHRRTRSPSPPPQDHHRHDRPQRPTVATDVRPRQSRGATFSNTPAEVQSARPSTNRHESARSAQPRSGSPRDSPPVSRHNSGRGNKLYGEMPAEDHEQAPYSRRYPPEQVSSSPRIQEQDIKYGHVRRPSTDESDRDYYPHSQHREQLRQPHMSSRRGSVY